MLSKAEVHHNDLLKAFFAYGLGQHHVISISRPMSRIMILDHNPKSSSVLVGRTGHATTDLLSDESFRLSKLTLLGRSSTNSILNGTVLPANAGILHELVNGILTRALHSCVADTATPIACTCGIHVVEDSAHLQPSTIAV